MKRTLILAALLVSWLGVVSVSQAQVFIRAPFVRVGVGDGVYVRAPFVNLYIPDGPRVVVTPPPPLIVPAPVPVMPPASEPVPQPKPGLYVPPPPPVALQPAPAPAVQQPQTLDAFAKSFQPKAGTYDLTVINPTTNASRRRCVSPCPKERRAA